ncbi:MAG: hypothetical protein AAFV72_00170 [Cyanobacteria bacterium J06635_1]
MLAIDTPIAQPAPITESVVKTEPLFDAQTRGRQGLPPDWGQVGPYAEQWAKSILMTMEQYKLRAERLQHELNECKAGLEAELFRVPDLGDRRGASAWQRYVDDPMSDAYAAPF